MRKSLGFTLAEVLITLAIIGVVAAMTIPSVIVNTNQQEFKTGLKKAVSVLNQAITMNMALENTSPSDLSSSTFDPTKTDNLMGYFAQRLNIIKSTTSISGDDDSEGANTNAAFYTADGMRFEFSTDKLGDLRTTYCGDGKKKIVVVSEGKATTEETEPCVVLVDVNGDKRPNPPAGGGAYIVPEPTGTRINDIFNIMITDSAAIPYGVVAQRTMFQND